MNPVFVNDMRKNLFRRKPVLAVAYMALAILVMTYIVFLSIPVSVGRWSAQQQFLWRSPYLFLPILAPMFAAGAFAKEHEQRTWQDILLTRLRASEILVGKFCASFLATLIALVVLFPPYSLLLIIQGLDWTAEVISWIPLLFLKTLIVAAFCIAAAFVCSYYSPNARVALVIIYALLAGYGMLNYLFWSFIVSPLFFGYPNVDPRYYYHRPDEMGQIVPAEFLLLIESAFWCAVLLAYLVFRVRGRRE